MANDDMCKQIGLLSRDGTYYFQARIPQDIRQRFRLDFPKPIIRKRLKATTLAEAKAQVRQHWADLEARFKQLREPPRTRLSDAEAKRILAAALASRLEADERGRRAGLDDWEINKSAEWLAECDAEERAGSSAR